MLARGVHVSVPARSKLRRASFATPLIPPSKGSVRRGQPSEQYEASGLARAIFVRGASEFCSSCVRYGSNFVHSKAECLYFIFTCDPYARVCRGSVCVCVCVCVYVCVLLYVCLCACVVCAGSASACISFRFTFVQTSFLIHKSLRYYLQPFPSRGQLTSYRCAFYRSITTKSSRMNFVCRRLGESLLL